VFIYKIDNHRRPAIARRQDFVIPQRREARFREGVHVLSAKGAASISAWGIAPQEFGGKRTSAERTAPSALDVI
jgi:hypothetical protein